MAIVKIQDRQYFVLAGDTICVDSVIFKDQKEHKAKCLLTGKEVVFEVKPKKTSKLSVVHFMNKTRRLRFGHHKLNPYELKATKVD